MTSRVPRGLITCAAVLTVACASATPRPAASTPPDDTAAYRAARERLVAAERALRMGATLALTAAEQTANARLAALKAAELTRTRSTFAPAQSFLLDRTKRLYDQSTVFSVLRRMPKGAVLHAHFTAMGDYRWIAARAIESPRTYILRAADGPIPAGSLRFADASPGPAWQRLAEVRAAASNPADVDAEVLRWLTLGPEDLTVTDIWEEFTTIFVRTRGLFADAAFTEAFFDHLVATLASENVQYLELRSPSVNEAWIMNARRHDSAFDVKFIPAAARSAPREQVAKFLAGLVEERHERPDRVKGFDFVQEEDRGNSNAFYIEQLIAARKHAKQRGTDLPLYLHSGESNWAENDNLYDAILLGARRLGHALALFKHPLLLREVKARDIAIEVCPISNQVLGYVSDLRNHPAVLYINSGLPVVLSSDDPGIFQSSLTHDFYVAYMAWGLDLKDLKQLALNSLQYSTMTPAERTRAVAVWHERWAAFIAWINATVPSA